MSNTNFKYKLMPKRHIGHSVYELDRYAPLPTADATPEASISRPMRV